MLVEIFLTLLIGYLTYKWVIYPSYLSPLRKIPGPPPDHFLLGNFIRDIITHQSGLVDHVELTEKYGGIFKIYGILNRQLVVVTDEKALQKILVSETSSFNKPKVFLGFLKGILGNGILVAEGEAHKRQRKLMNPVFSHGNIKDMVPAFAKLGNAIKELWKNEIKNNQNDVNDNSDVVEKKRAKIDVMNCLSKAALDAIGIVGFDYEFNSLKTTSKLAQAYENLFGSRNRFAVAYRILANIIPILGLLPLKQIQDSKKASLVIKKVTTELINDKFNKFGKGELDNKNDLLASLIKANHKGNLNKSEQMTIEELRNQIMTFLFAGHETTSVAVTWVLHYLSMNLEAQDKLRKEIVKEFPDKDFVPTLEQINSLEYLNAVCKESLRLTPSIPLTLRVPNKDIIINGYLVPKETIIIIPIFTLHNMASTWGPDVKEFKPSRWFEERTTKVVTNCNYMPFMTGPRSCIGNKVAFNEMKVFIAVLIRNFEFHEVEGSKIKAQLNLTFRPNPSLALWANEIDY